MDIMELKKEYSKRKKEIKSRLKEFKEQDDYFYELCFCLLTPQSSAYKCDECISVLKKRDFAKNNFEIHDVLKKYTRFYRNKSNYMLLFKDKNEKILKDLNNIQDVREKRDYLVNNVKGLGLKESSHFLRNVGHKGLAILDRHILKNLVKLGVIEKIPSSLTRKTYLEIEEKFLRFADDLNIPIDELDLLFWSMETGKIFK
jgi:N-glycosylase/DNA lyase